MKLFKIKVPEWIKSLRGNSANVNGAKDSNVYIFQNSPVSLEGVIEKIKVVSKSELTNEDYETYLENVKIPENLIERKLIKKEVLSSDNIGFIDTEKKEETILEILKKDSKVVLLGNPGLGKTIELKRTAIRLWDDKDEVNIPIYRNLKNFTSQNGIKDYIFIDCERIDNAIFILDGIDEIPNVQDFISKLQLFINSTKNKNYKFLISCRTNVFESVVKIVDDFQVYYLKNLSVEEGLNILNKKTNFQDLSYESLDRNLMTFLKNPFLVGIIIDYINSEKKLPTNTAELWDKYIDKRLTIDVDQKLIKKSLNETLIKHFSKKISLINELCKINSFTNNQLLKTVNNNTADFESFLLNPMLEKKVSESVWYFEHKNIQEYFSSKVISTLELDKIISFIQIQDLGKTHPSLFNTITFILNTLDKSIDKYKGLINWISENEPEILFNADSDRIPIEIRIEVFQNFFREKSIVSTLWLTSNRAVDLDKVSRFADCEENCEFLLQVISDKTIHIRPRVSALRVLSLFNIPLNKKEETKECLFKFLKNKEVTKDFKCSVLEFFGKNTLYRNDKAVIDEIIQLFKEDTHNRINRNLLRLIKNINEADKYSEYLIEEFLRANKFKERLDNSDNVSRGNSYESKNLVLSFKDHKNTLIIIKHYLNDTSSYYLDDDADKILNKILEFNDEEVLEIFKGLKGDVKYLRHEKLLYEVIEQTKIKNQILIYLLKELEFENVGYFSSKLIDESNVKEVVGILKGKDLQQIERFRNYIGDINNRKFAEKYDSLMKEEGIVFKEKVFTKEDEENREIEQERLRKEYLEGFFDFKKLCLGIESFFIENDFEKLNYSELRDFECNKKDWSFHHYDFFNSSISVIKNVLLYFDDGYSSSQIIEKLKEDNFFIFNRIKSVIESFNSNNHSFELTLKQNKYIEEWVLKTCDEINFSNIIKLYEDGSYSYISNNYKKIETIFFFDKILEIDLPSNFLLSCLPYFQMENYDSQIDKYQMIFDRVNNKMLFDKEVISNITGGELFNFSLIPHINYALHNNLEEVYPIVRNSFVAYSTSMLYEKDIMKSLFEKTNDVSFLRECCANLEKKIAWHAIEIMLEENIEKDFIYEKSIEYLRGDSVDTFFHPIAMEVLLKQNRIEALEFIENEINTKYLKSQVKEYKSLISLRGFENFNVIKDYNIIKVLFNYSYRGNDVNFRDVADYREFLRKFVDNLIEEEASYNRVKEIFVEIKEDWISTNEDLFYINQIIDETNSSYLAYKSIPFKFEEALSIANEIT